ncbi:hypothetical protein E3P98_02487 [Wallemia ichthyophaga]|nr:hypothetical protein E3P98_02487 [Wallemia ichthyophaga]
MRETEVNSDFTAPATSTARPSLIYQSPNYYTLWKTTTQALCGQLDMKSSVEELLQGVNLKPPASEEVYFTQIEGDMCNDKDNKMSTDEMTKSEIVPDAEAQDEDKQMEKIKVDSGENQAAKKNQMISSEDVKPDVKPCSTELEQEHSKEAENILRSLRILIFTQHPPNEKTTMKCFGNFENWSNSIAINSFSKNKEIFHITNALVIMGTLADIYGSFGQIGISLLTTVVFDDLVNNDEWQETLSAVARRIEEK